MATYSKPGSIPYWADDQVNNVEPSEEKKSLGWLFGEEPPSSVENWKSNLIGNWFKWLDERFADDDESNDTLVVNVGDSLTIKANDAIRASFGVTSYIGASPSDGFVFVNGANDKEFRFGNSQKKFSYNITDNELDFFFGDSTPVTRLSFPGITTRGGVYIGAPSTESDVWSKDLRIEGGMNSGGAVNPLPGVGIFSTGIAAGYDGSSPAFGAGFGDAGNTIVLDGDGNPLWTTDTGDSIKFKRAENRFGINIATTEQQRVDVDGVSYRHGSRKIKLNPVSMYSTTWTYTVGAWRSASGGLYMPIPLAVGRYLEDVSIILSVNAGSYTVASSIRRVPTDGSGVLTVVSASGNYSASTNVISLTANHVIEDLSTYYIAIDNSTSGSNLNCSSATITYKKLSPDTP